MFIKTIFFLNLILLSSCNIASVITDAETELGDNFSQDLRGDLIGFWKLDESGTAENRLDSFGSLDLTNSGSAVVVSGVRGNGVDFQTSSSGSGLLCNSSPGVNLSNSEEYTISFWAYDNDGAGGGYAIDFDQTTIRVNTGGGYYEISTDQDASHTASSYNPPTGQWIHYAFVFKAVIDTVDLYVNGNFYESLSVGDSGLVPSSLCIGTRNIGGLQYPGYMDSVGFWSKALSSNEIKALYSGNNNVD